VTKPDPKPTSIPTPSTFMAGLTEIHADPASNARRTPDPEVEASIEASMRDRLARGLHPQETACWVVARDHGYVLRAGFTRLRCLDRVAKTPPGNLPPEGRAWVEKPTVWVSLHDADDFGADILNLRENVQRQALTTADLTVAVAALRRRHPDRTTKSIADEIGCSDRHLSNLLRTYASLLPEAWSAFERRAIVFDQAVKLAAIKDPDAQRAAFQAMLEDAPKKRTKKAAAKPGGAADPSDSGEGDDTDDDGEGGADDGKGRLTRRRAEDLGRRIHALVEAAVSGELGDVACPHPYTRGVRAVLAYVSEDMHVARDALWDDLAKCIAAAERQPGLFAEPIPSPVKAKAVKPTTPARATKARAPAPARARTKAPVKKAAAKKGR
jgi:ParB-like chromosome segregation protein Spo0J